jgi:polyhydroxybutyrate depolymerase
MGTPTVTLTPEGIHDHGLSLRGALRGLALCVGLGVAGCGGGGSDMPASSGPGTAAPAPAQPASGAAGAGGNATAVQPTSQAPALTPPAAPPASPAPAQSGAPAAPPAPASEPPAPVMTPAPDALPAPAGAPDPSPACSGTAAQPGRTMHTVDVGGQTRNYVRYVPPGYDGTKPVPVLLLLHGGASDAANAESSSNMRPVADSEGFIYLAPNAIGGMWMTESDGDELFFRAALEQLGEEACIDRRRVYSTGCSMGGAMSFWLACNAADIIAAVAPLCGSAFFDLNTQCMPQRPISVMHTIGAQDTLNCWEGEPSGSQPGAQCAKGVLAAFQKINECKGEVHPTHDGICESVGECAGGTEVTVCRVDIGHILWSAPDMDVPQEHWNFLERFSLP